MKKIIEIHTSDIQLILEVLTNVAYSQTVQGWDKSYFIINKVGNLRLLLAALLQQSLQSSGYR
jgi:L-rhamnose isomerase